MRDPLALKGTFIFVTTLDMKRHHTVLLFHCIIFKAFWENAGSLLSHQVSMSLLIKDVLFRRMSSALPTLSSLQRLSGPPCSAKFLSLDHKKNPSVPQKCAEKLIEGKIKSIKSSFRISSMTRLLLHVPAAPWSPESHSGRGGWRIRAERQSAESSSAEDQMSNWHCETQTDYTCCNGRLCRLT